VPRYDRVAGWGATVGDNAGALGAFFSAAGCAMCFPALASIGAAVGLGFLSQWEGLFINTLLPAFAWLVIVSQVLGWFAHRQWRRSLLGLIGPGIVLLSLYPWWQYGWSTWSFYTGLSLMIAVGVWDLISPAHRHCPDESRRQAPAEEIPLEHVHEQ